MAVADWIAQKAQRANDDGYIVLYTENQTKTKTKTKQKEDTETETGTETQRID